MGDQWLWYLLLCGALGVAIGEIRVLHRRLVEALHDRDNAMLALRLNIARQLGEQSLLDLGADWERHCELEGLVFDDGDEAAHAFADFLANQTGQPIVAQQLGGEGIIVAIPDEEEPSA